MQETYKNHLIRSNATSLPNGSAWKPIGQVNWTENGRERVMLWMQWHFYRTFQVTMPPKRKAIVSLNDGLMDDENQK